MTHDLSGKVALITGASRGIGAAVARAVAGAGAHVVLLARTVGGLEEVDDAIRAAGGTATLIPMDLAKFDEVDKLGPSIAERFGRLDILIGNAALAGALTPVHQIKPRDWEKPMNVNFMANVRLVASCDPLLRAAPAGRVVFTTTGLADQALAYWGPYAASKAALNLFVRTYAAETMKTNLRVNLLSPGVVDTAMLRAAYPGGYPGGAKNPEEVTGAFLDLCALDCTKHGEIVAL
jgi:NAD(P)-dependent dehydrogenase (short-subunit alcohol dehydrogenase family)